MIKLRQLFSFGGRTSRIGYWRTQIGLLLVMAAFWCGGLVLADATGAGAWSAVALAGCAPVYWLALALLFRRLPDRNKSAWWLLPFQATPLALAIVGPQQLAKAGDLIAGLVVLADVVLVLWAFVEIGLLRGTRGPNRYGPDPQSA
jgi:uncharacterized membrane protein YhaH (DUF805 family)